MATRFIDRTLDASSMWRALSILVLASCGGDPATAPPPISNPAPKITSVTPNLTPIQSPSSSDSLVITIDGSGFIAESKVNFGSATILPTSATSTEIVVKVPYSYLAAPRSIPVTLVNPTPGGGTSNAVDFGVLFPTPTVESFSPDSAFTADTAFTLKVYGTGFYDPSIVRWNGVDRLTVPVSRWEVTATISPGEMSSPGNATVSVFNPTPGGGLSNSLTFRVSDRGPLISRTDPGVITVGSGSTIVTVTGSNFQPGATAQWNGNQRGSSVSSSTSLSVTLTSTDLAVASVGEITVTNPGASGISNAMKIAVVPDNPALAIVRTIALSNTALVYDARRGVIYASVPDTASSHSNSIARVDPLTGAITGYLPVGKNPGPLELTDDGQYLYVGLYGEDKIVRVALGTFSKDIEIVINRISSGYISYAEDILAIPGAPHTIAVTTFFPDGVSPRDAGTLIFDDTTRRPTVLFGSNRIARGTTPARIYGRNTETSPQYGFLSILVFADGLHLESSKEGIATGLNMEYSGGLIYTDFGAVIDPTVMQLFGTIPQVSADVRPDAANARVHFLLGSTITTYQYRTFTEMGTIDDPSISGHLKMIRWGSDGLALGGGPNIMLLRGARVGQ
jgi:hypothetical protein